VSSSPTSERKRTLFADVSDTARWVAHYRALETERKGGILRDPFARRLAGERGRLIAEALPELSLRWMIPVRARIFDELLLETLATREITTVLNLAAGLDTRPYRLELPASLRFVEADLPALLTNKSELLARERPRCALERVPLDVTDERARDALLTRLADEGARIVVVMEGVLAYLAESEVVALSRALYRAPAVHAWILEAAMPEALTQARRAWGAALAGGRAAMKFAPASGLNFYSAHGWEPKLVRSLLEEAERYGRQMRFAALARVVTKWLRGAETWRKMAMYAVMEKRTAAGPFN
jgi:methyltransferase (TIGR00027 family)